MHVGAIIRGFRKERDMTLVELSQKSGVALATLSRMENGKMTGTLQSHIDIAKALELPLTELYKDLPSSKPSIEVKARPGRSAVSIRDNKASVEMLASNISGKKMMPVLIRIAKNGRTHEDKTKYGIEKFIYVVSGAVEAMVGEQAYRLTMGDTLYFESSVPHYFKNVSGGESRLISVTSPPIL